MAKSSKNDQSDSSDSADEPAPKRRVIGPIGPSLPPGMSLDTSESRVDNDDEKTSDAKTKYITSAQSSDEEEDVSE